MKKIWIAVDCYNILTRYFSIFYNYLNLQVNVYYEDLILITSIFKYNYDKII